MTGRLRTAPWIGIALLALGTAAMLRAQGAAGPPKPGPEHKQLAYFVGNWTSTGEMKPSPFGPGGKTTGKDHCEPFTGGFHVVCHSESTGPMGSMKGIGLLGYNVEEKVYTYFGIDSIGSNDSARGTMTAPDTWVYTGEAKLGGKTIKSRYTIKKIDANSYTFKWETQEGASWNPVMEGKSTRGKGATKATS